jgi:hypothetical protein
LQRKKCPISCRTRQRFLLAASVFSLVIWLFMTAAELCSPVHAWLHGGTIPDEDNCALVAIAHGKVETVLVDAPMAVPVIGIEIVPRLEFSFFRPAIAFLPDGRGPPVPTIPS